MCTCTCSNMDTNIHTCRYSSDKWQSLMAVKTSCLIKLGGPREEVVGGQEERKHRGYICLSALNSERRGRRWEYVTALISCSRCVIYKADLAPWHARMGDMGVRMCARVCERCNVGGGTGASLCMCVSAYRWVSSSPCAKENKLSSFLVGFLSLLC